LKLSGNLLHRSKQFEHFRNVFTEITIKSIFLPYNDLASLLKEYHWTGTLTPTQNPSRVNFDEKSDSGADIGISLIQSAFSKSSMCPLYLNKEETYLSYCL